MPITVTLERGQWQAIVNLLMEGRFRDVAPLIVEIQRQLGPNMKLPGSNGADAPESLQVDG